MPASVPRSSRPSLLRLGRTDARKAELRGRAACTRRTDNSAVGTAELRDSGLMPLVEANGSRIRPSAGGPGDEHGRFA